jgi:metal-dependent amidase/aminoacylase/carboxypeptidase family protein
MNLAEWIEENRPMFTSLSDEIWGYAELGYKEFKSSKTIEDALEESPLRLWRATGKADP